MENIKYGLLGYGGAFSSDEENLNNSFYLKLKDDNKDEIFLIDCGEMNFHKVKNLIEKLKTGKVNVYITHLHPDHIGGLTTLYFYMKIIRPNIEFKIFSPGKKSAEEIKILMRLMGADKEGIDRTVEYFSETFVAKYTDGEILFKGHTVKHSENMESFGYEIILKKGNEQKTLWFSGDCSLSQNSEIKNIIEKADIVFHEMTIYKTPVHTNAEEYVKFYSKEICEKTIPMHLGKEELEKVKEIMKEKNINIDFIEKFYSNKREIEDFKSIEID